MKWLLMLAGLATLFVVWSWVPLQKLDRYWRLNNPIGRPFVHTLVLTGIPAWAASHLGLQWPGLLIPICFFITQYAVLSGRFIESHFNTAGWVMLMTTVVVWIAFFAM